jgi:hypothetical protein
MLRTALLAVAAAAACGLASVDVNAPAYGDIYVFAGSISTPGDTGDGGLATSATLQQPRSAYADADGSVLISDYVAFRIRRVAAGNIEAAVAAGPAVVNGVPIDPAGMDRLPTGELVFASPLLNAVVKVAPGGARSLLAGATAPGPVSFVDGEEQALGSSLASPIDVKMSKDGTTLYICDSTNSRLRGLNLATMNVTTLAGKTSAGQALSAAPSASDGYGPVDARATPMFTPGSISVVEEDGSVLLADTYNCMIRRYYTNDTMAIVAGALPKACGDGSLDGAAAAGAQLNLPRGVAVFPGGRGFVIADTFNYKIRHVTPDGRMWTIAGTGVPGTNGNGGDGRSAQLTMVFGIAVTASGVVIVPSFEASSRGYVQALGTPVPSPTATPTATATVSCSDVVAPAVVS